MKRILLIGSLPPPFHGSNLYNLNLLNSKIKNVFEIYHLDTSDNRSLKNIGKIDFINIKAGMKNLFSLINILRKNKPDLVYIPIAQNIAFIRDGIFIITSKLFKLNKIIIHLHGGNFLNYYNNCNYFFRKFIDFSLNKVDCAIVLGDSLRYIFKKWIKNIYVVPNGLDFCTNFKEKNYLKNEIINIGFLGNILEEKGILDLLEAFKIIFKKNENIQLNIGGEWVRSDDNFKKKVYEFIKRNNMSKKIVFKGYISQDDKEEFLLNTDIFIYPSWNEGQPLAIIEAMAAGCPIIAIKDVGAISETVIDKETGILVSKRNSHEMASAIMELINNPKKRIEFGLNARKRYEEFYTFTKHLEKILEVLNSI